MTTVADHDSYIAAAPQAFQAALAELRARIARALPDAEEVVKYGMPGFRIGSSIVASYAAFARSCGLYVSAGAIGALANELAAEGLKSTKTGVTFAAARPIPGDLVERLAAASRRDLGV